MASSVISIEAAQRAKHARTEAREPRPTLLPSPESAAPSVVCIVLNWNGREDTLECLGAVSQLNYERFSVIVVDNGSTDDSVKAIRAAYPHIEVLETGRNLGFAAGNNVGLVRALQSDVDYVWLLNNDTQPRADALRELVERAESNPRLGAVGSVLWYAHAPDTLQVWGGGRLSRWFGYSLHADGPREDEWFDYITGASILLRRQALEDVSLLDASFFLYWEDGDLGYRLRERGWKLSVAERSQVLHKERVNARRNAALIDRYTTTSGIRFLVKHSPLPWLSVPAFLLMRLSKRLLVGDIRRIGDVARGVRDYFSVHRPGGSERPERR